MQAGLTTSFCAQWCVGPLLLPPYTPYGLQQWTMDSDVAVAHGTVPLAVQCV